MILQDKIMPPIYTKDVMHSLHLLIISCVRLRMKSDVVLLSCAARVSPKRI